MSEAKEPTGSIEMAIAHARRLLQTDPQLAAEQAAEILKVAPQYPPAQLLRGVALRTGGDWQAALEVLQPLASQQPNWAAAHYELGVCFADAAQPGAALAAWRRAVALKPAMPDAWRAIGDHLTLIGDREGADAAYARHIKASTQDPRLLIAASALVDGRVGQAELLLREHLKQHPTDVPALRMLAEVAARLGRNADAEALLERCLELSPSFAAARQQYAIILNRQNKIAAALAEVDRLERDDPRNTAYRNLRAVILVKIGEYRQSIELYEQVLAAHPEHPKIWLSYGHTLATAGREADSVAAYRRSIALSPQLGEAYWSLANLKTFRFADADVAAMRAQLAREGLTSLERAHMNFALGKALEDQRSFDESFKHYAAANRLRRQTIDYVAEETTQFVSRSRELLSKEFFAARAEYGCIAADPIFIVGMPRAGSTLIEQILASHSSVEGTMELPDILMLAAELAGTRKASEEPRYPAILADLAAEACRALGARYLEQTRIQRKTDKPFFIDKMPNNFLHLGLILLALPRANITRTASRTSDSTTATTSISWRISTRFCRGGSIGSFTSPWSTTPRSKYDGYSITASCRSNTHAYGFTKIPGPCAPRARSKSASRSFATRSTSGVTTTLGWARLSRHWAPCSRATRRRRDFQNNLGYEIYAVGVGGASTIWGSMHDS